MRRWIVVASAIALFACDQSSPGTDAGADAGSVDAGGTDGGGTGTPFTYAVVLRETDVFGGDVAPVIGARVVVDTDAGRFEAVTDTEGRASVEATSSDGRFDVLYAADGFYVDAEVGRAVSAIGAEPETVSIARLVGAVPAATVRVDAGGVPPGGRWCLSPGPWFLQCSGANVISVMISESVRSRTFTAFAIDAEGTVVEAVTGELMEGDPVSASIVFDGTSELSITSREVRIQLPTDPASPFADHAVLEDFHGWLAAADTHRALIRGLVTNVTPADGNALTATFWEAKADGESLVYANAAYPAAHERGAVRVYRWYPATPPDETSFMDVPRPHSEGMSLGDPIEWTAVEGADFYAIVVEVDDQIVMRVRSAHAEPFRFPALPDGFDASAVFPPGEEWAVMRPVAVAGELPRGSYAVDGQLSRGPAFSLMR